MPSASRWSSIIGLEPGGALGAELAAKAPPDGYTLWIGQTADLAIGPALRKKSPYDPVRDFAPITMVQRASSVFVVSAVREKYPDQWLSLHLHDTRGMGIANAMAGLEMGVTMFDACVAGLGGCPFAAHKGAAGNVCTEDLVFMCQEMGIETGIDLDKMIECAQLAEAIVGHPLPGSVKMDGNLAKLRAAVAAA
jgi:hypothetical protein